MNSVVSRKYVTHYQHVSPEDKKVKARSDEPPLS